MVGLEDPAKIGWLEKQFPNASARDEYAYLHRTFLLKRFERWIPRGLCWGFFAGMVGVGVTQATWTLPLWGALGLVVAKRRSGTRLREIHAYATAHEARLEAHEHHLDTLAHELQSTYLAPFLRRYEHLGLTEHISIRTILQEVTEYEVMDSETMRRYEHSAVGEHVGSLTTLLNVKGYQVTDAETIELLRRCQRHEKEALLRGAIKSVPHTPVALATALLGAIPNPSDNDFVLFLEVLAEEGTTLSLEELRAARTLVEEEGGGQASSRPSSSATRRSSLLWMISPG